MDSIAKSLQLKVATKVECWSFLVNVNVQKASPFKIIEHYILSKYKSEEWKSCEPQILIDHLKYIKDHWSELKKQQDEIIELFSDKPIIRCEKKEQ